MNRYRIDEITDWDVNRPLVQANADHGGEDYNAAYAEACSVRDEMLIVGGKDVPFECDAENEDEALAKYAEKYADELVVPTDAIITQLHKFAVSLQVDTRISIDVYAESAEEAGELAESADFEMKDLEYIESHPVNAYDYDNKELTDLC